MKRMLNRLLGAIGLGMLLMGGGVTLTTWSPSASAQSYFCSGTTCYYGPICPDAWGGCYYYTWSIGSAVNTWSEKAGIAPVVKLCDPTKPETCVYVESDVELVTSQGGYNVLLTCQVPGSKTCTDGKCGGSPNSSGSVFLNLQFSQSVTSTVKSNECTRDDRDKGGIKCSKTNTLKLVEGSSEYCPNSNWVVSKAIPLNFYGTTTATGPLSKQNIGTIVSTTAKVQCWLKDPSGKYPYESGYSPSPNMAYNTLECVER